MTQQNGQISKTVPQEIEKYASLVNYRQSFWTQAIKMDMVHSYHIIIIIGSTNA